MSEFTHQFVQGESGTTLLLLHGTGGNENDLLPLGREIAPHANLLSPRGRVLENGMPRFFRRLAEGVFDVPDLIARTHELANFVTQSAQAHHFDPTKIIPVGYSNGANIAASLLLLRAEKFPAAILFRPMVPLVPDQLPDLRNTRVFIASGRSDPIVPAKQTAQLAALFESAGAPVTEHLIDTGHALISDDLKLARQWLAAIHLT